MKTIIAGGRDFKDWGYFEQSMDIIESCWWHTDRVVCGGAKGADTFGEKWAYGQGILVDKFPADWKTYGNSAGMIRNQEMANYADALVAFWNRKSRGTKDMISRAIKKGLCVKVFYYDA